MLVVWTHLSELFPSYDLNSYGPSGLEGVDLFFVISGFIMVYTTSRETPSPLSFLFRRFIRIAPLYYIATFVVIAIFLVMPSALKSTAVDLPAIIKSAFFIPYEKSDGRIYPLYYLGWTLNYEMFFYLLFSISLLIRRDIRTYACALVVIALAATGVFIHSDEYGVLAYAYTRPIMLNFALGMLIAETYDAIFVRTRGNTTLHLVIAGVGMLLMLSLGRFFNPPYTIAPVTSTFLTQGLPAGLLVLGTVLLEKAGRVSPKNWLTAVGDASYSIYLFHFFMVAVLLKICDRFMVPDVARIGVTIIALPAICAASYIIYRVVERPIIKLFSKRRASNSGMEKADRARPIEVRG